MPRNLSQGPPARRGSWREVGPRPCDDRLRWVMVQRRLHSQRGSHTMVDRCLRLPSKAPVVVGAGAWARRTPSSGAASARHLPPVAPAQAARRRRRRRAAWRETGFAMVGCQAAPRVVAAVALGVVPAAATANAVARGSGGSMPPVARPQWGAPSPAAAPAEPREHAGKQEATAVHPELVPAALGNGRSDGVAVAALCPTPPRLLGGPGLSRHASTGQRRRSSRGRNPGPRLWQRGGCPSCPWRYVGLHKGCGQAVRRRASFAT
mmetsp:Transcript_27462/g.69518  ORF Transcript_27462/g.69518 Transcript_27462/m.69518 type:complete len:264 (+) Transcript_27462:283-1074(+)